MSSGKNLNPEKQAFFRENAELAMEEQIRYGIPASVTLIQMYWESGRGKSDIAREANNYFGIKDHEGAARGDIVYRHDDIDEKNAPFKVFKSKQDSVRGHSLFLMRDNYKSLHQLSATDYEGWLKGLKRCGYATAAGYDTKLINDLEYNELQKYDKMAEKKAAEQGVRCGYMRGARDHCVRTATHTAHTSAGIGFRMPLDGDNLTMSSPFGNRIHPNTHRPSFHNGIDIVVPTGTKLYSTEDRGVVKRVNWGVDNNGDGKVDLDAKGNPKINGKCVEVEYRHGKDTYTVQYLHMSRVDVKEGQTVDHNTLLGLSGATGRGTGAHLHYGVKKNGEYINPVSYLADIAVLSESKAKIMDMKHGTGDVLAAAKQRVDETQLMALKADAARQADASADLARAEHQEKEDEGRSKSIEDTVARTAKSNIFSALLGKDGDGLSQIFSGGSDLTSNIISMLMMSFLALAFNKRDEEEVQQKAISDGEQNATRKEDYNVYENRGVLDAKAMAEMSSTTYDISSPDQSVGQEISQQERSGYSV